MDFKSYVNSNANKRSGEEQKGGMDYASVLSALAGKYEGASEEEIISAIIEEAEKSRRNGTLSDADIDAFANSVSPLLTPVQRKKLAKVVKFLKGV